MKEDASKATNLSVLAGENVCHEEDDVIVEEDDREAEDEEDDLFNIIFSTGGRLQEALRRCAIDIDLPRHIIMLISDIRTDLVLLSGIKNPSHMNSLLAF